MNRTNLRKIRKVQDIPHRSCRCRGPLRLQHFPLASAEVGAENPCQSAASGPMTDRRLIGLLGEYTLKICAVAVPREVWTWDRIECGSSWPLSSSSSLPSGITLLAGPPHRQATPRQRLRRRQPPPPRRLLRTEDSVGRYISAASRDITCRPGVQALSCRADHLNGGWNHPRGAGSSCASPRHSKAGGGSC
jgi:hypothetical protein